LVVLVAAGDRRWLGAAWSRRVGEFATLVWRGAEQGASELEEHETTWSC
jgi:hypothetical protein